MTYQGITIVGNLGRDPEMKYLPDGKAVTNFSVAVAGYKKEDSPMWVKVTVWGAAAENCNKFLSKGSKVLVTGRLNYDTTTGNPRLFSRQDGTVGSSFEVTANEVRFLSGKGDVAESPDGESQTAVPSTKEDDEIPF